jgi:hypothetical protein
MALMRTALGIMSSSQAITITAHFGGWGEIPSATASINGGIRRWMFFLIAP